jgi:aconitate hydratase
MGAVNAFSGQSGSVFNQIEKKDMSVAESAAIYRDKAYGSVIVAEDNYGEGSSREHAAMEPRYMGVKAVIAKNFARIHETNLKKQGVLALTFCNPADYDLVRQDDTIDVLCAGIQPGNPVDVVLHHADGTSDKLQASHTYNNQQLVWFKAGSALNSLKQN